MIFKKKIQNVLCITLIAVFLLSLTTVFAADTSDVEIKLQIDNPFAGFYDAEFVG